MIRLGRYLFVLSVMATCCFTKRVAAQPASFVDLGDLGIPGTLESSELDVPIEGGVWFRIRLTSPVKFAENWIDFDTSGSQLQDTAIAIYDSHAILRRWDQTSGSGDRGAMSFGGGSGQRFGPDGRISPGDVPNLEDGVYYVGVQSGDAEFPFVNRSWNFPTGNGAGGSVHLIIHAGLVPSSSWNEEIGIEAGDVPSIAAEVVGNGDLTTILGGFSAQNRDMFKIQLCDPSAFQIIGSMTDDVGVTRTPRLFLFDSNGHGVLAVSGPGGGGVVLSSSTLAIGDYFIAVSNLCPGEIVGVEPFPYDATDQLLWNSLPGNGVPVAPNGPGAGNSIAYWGPRQSCHNVDSYDFKLTLTGACYLGSSPTNCPADLDHDGVVGIQDLAAILSAFGTMCP